MEDRKEFFFVNRSFPAALAIAAGILLAPCQSAFAAECTKKQSEPAMDAAIETQWGGVTVPSDDRQRSTICSAATRGLLMSVTPTGLQLCLP